ncbi:Uncharacterised protein [Sphingobacterium multivorum]|uniref:hypothetical protein n=1 Tax=Sphingobacterium multivorum TaxID=28454 RepID=UPI000E086B95|nr:hypothetical protein [Sphingobacterium multivorum]QQT44913.1 hypothetical protein I6J00_24990 [Sphingobacterium multivorum]SUJ18387.1 Uncharacterised protein [Sphingobacterium multivorum]
MQANELRIGNYVASDHFKDRDVIVKIRLIGQDQAIVEHPNGLSEPMLYKGEMMGVMLTEEILINNCGFERHPELTWLLSNGMMTLNTGNHNTWQYAKSVLKEINYLHILQNVFYALHQRELEVKL